MEEWSWTSSGFLTPLLTACFGFPPVPGGTPSWPLRRGLVMGNIAVGWALLQGPSQVTEVGTGILRLSLLPGGAENVRVS